MKKRITAMVLVAAMAVTAFAGCGKSSSDAESGSYTYHSTIASFNTWSPTDWQLENEATLIGYTSSVLWDFLVDDSTSAGYKVVPSMATAMPEDVTAEYAGNESYGVPADATEGYAWKVDIREDATWEDGTPITADDFVYTMQTFLDPEMANYRASSYYDGTGAIANAKAYYSGGSAIAADNYTSLSDFTKNADGVYTTPDGAELNFTFTTALSWMDGASWSDYLGQGYGIDDIADELLAMGDGENLVPVTDDSIALLYSYTGSDEWGNESEDDLLNYMTYESGDSVSWDNVGFVKTGDYEFVIILANATTEFYVEYNFSSLTLLNKDLYEANKEETGGVIKSSYGTAIDKYSSYGPYKFEEYQEGKYVKLVKNDNWFGYSDPTYDGLYQTTAIELQEIDDASTQVSMFLQGNLDDVTLTSDYIDDYSTSDYIYYMPESYTAAFAFNTDFDALKSREEEGQNKTILTYEDFRKAFSLAIDRNDYCKSCTSGYDAAYGLLNDLYIYDPDTMSKYRDTEVAQQVLCDIYDVDTVDDLTGYDKEEASELLQSAYDACAADGNISDGDVVTIDYHVYGSDSTYQKLVDYVQDALLAAAEGTSLEGRIKVELVEDQDFYTTMKSGQDDMVREAWGGADFDPFGVMWCYCDPDTITEYGYDSTAVDLTIDVNGESVTMSMADWYVALCQGEYTAADIDTKNAILAAMEEKLLSDYHVVPVAAYTSGTLYSQRIVLGSSTYVNSLVGFGGIGEITYTMDDAEWSDYCADQNNQLTY